MKDLWEQIRKHPWVTALVVICLVVGAWQARRQQERTPVSQETQACHQALSAAGVNMFDIPARCEKIRRGEWPAGVPMTAK